MSIRQRILCALGSLLFVGSLVSWLAVRMIHDMESSISFLSSNSAVQAGTAAKMVTTLARLQNQLAAMLSTSKRLGEGDEQGQSYLDQQWAGALTEYQSLQTYLSNCATAARATSSSVRRGQSFGGMHDAGVVESPRHLGELDRQLANFRPHLEAFYTKVKGSPSEARIYLEGELDLVLADLIRSFNQYLSQAEGDLAVAAIEARAHAGRTVTSIILLWCLAAGCIAGLTWWSVRSLVARLAVIRQAVASLGQGGLGIRLPTGEKDELGGIADAFNRMCEDLHRTTLSRDYVEAILQNTPLPLIVVSPSGFIRSANRACERLLNIGPNELDSLAWAALFPSGGSLPLAAVLSKDVVLRAHGNVLIPVSLSMSAVRNEDDQPLDWICLAEDLRERKKTEEAMRELQANLVESSRKAGMSEIATGVLHNIGNVLNSVNVSANLLLDQLRTSRASSFTKAAELLRLNLDQIGTFITSDPKGQKLPKFIIGLSEQLNLEQKAWSDELAQLLRNIEHIKQVVAVQQSYAKLSGVMERLSVETLLEDAMRLSSASLARHQIEVIRAYDPVPEVFLDRHKTLQILINLVNNAKQALLKRPLGRQLTLRIQKSLDGTKLRIHVADNGEGIEPQNQLKIFQHGFTTKSTGHGFGLHSGANSAKEMGGALSVSSLGTGCGAEFTLELPLNVTQSGGGTQAQGDSTTEPARETAA
jgi:signal transduction histidine kinase